MDDQQYESAKLVDVGSMANDSEALVVKSLLESHGIRVVMKTSLVQSVHPITVNGVGQVRVMVAEKDAEMARALLDEDGLPRLAGE